MLKFDGNNLTPAGPIQSSEAEVEKEFVANFNMLRRHNINKAYKEYMGDLRTVLKDVPFKQWINGSFVTKKTNPNDIDVVTFLPRADYDRLQEQLKPLSTPEVKSNYSHYVDAYIMPMEKEFENYWELEFSKVKGRDNLPLVGFKKGFIEIKS